MKRQEYNNQKLIDIELSISSLKEQKSKLSIDKKTIEAEFSNLKNTIRTTKNMSDGDYAKICRKQKSLKQDLISVETAIAGIGNEILKRNILKEEVRNSIQNKDNSEIKDKIIELKDYYINYASDRTRIASTRSMAAEIAKSLEKLIKPLD